MRSRTIHSVAVGAGILFAGVGANAQYFNYSVTFGAYDGTNYVDGAVVTTNLNGTNMTVAGQNAANGNATGGTDILLTNLTNNSARGVPETLGYVANSAFTTGAPYRLTVTITDANSSHIAIAAPLTQFLYGTLTGTIASNAGNVSNTYTSLSSVPTYNGSSLADVATFAFGTGDTFILRAYNNQFTGPGVAGVSGVGAQSAHIVGLTGQPTPEPGSLALLFGSGVVGSLAAARRKRARG